MAGLFFIVGMKRFYRGWWYRWSNNDPADRRLRVVGAADGSIVGLAQLISPFDQPFDVQPLPRKQAAAAD